MANDLSSVLRSKSVGSLDGRLPRCSDCRRTPLGGEMMHVFEGERVLCTLCLGRLGEGHGEPLRSERVPAGERRVALVRSAA